jgi:hypothetical protein
MRGVPGVIEQHPGRLARFRRLIDAAPAQLRRTFDAGFRALAERRFVIACSSVGICQPKTFMVIGNREFA